METTWITPQLESVWSDLYGVVITSMVPCPHRKSKFSYGIQGIIQTQTCLDCGVHGPISDFKHLDIPNPRLAPLLVAITFQSHRGGCVTCGHPSTKHWLHGPCEECGGPCNFIIDTTPIRRFQSLSGFLSAGALRGHIEDALLECGLEKFTWIYMTNTNDVKALLVSLTQTVREMKNGQS